jgi:hypothetical protein
MTTGRSSNSSQEFYTASDDQTAHTAVPSGMPDTSDTTPYLVTMNERGQVVLPAILRNACHLHPHDKLLVFRDPSAASALVLVKIDQLLELVRWYRTGGHR